MSTIYFSYRGSPVASDITTGAWKSQNSYYGVRFPGIRKHYARSNLSVRSAPPSLGGKQTNHQIRRHMQRKRREGMGQNNEMETKDDDW